MKPTIVVPIALLVAGCATMNAPTRVSAAQLHEAPACTCTTAVDDAAKIALVKRFYAAMNARSHELLADVLAADWADIPMPPGQAPGLAGMQKSVRNFGSVFKDFHVVNDEFVVSGDTVVVRSTNTGIHIGTFAGIAPTGKSFTMTSIDIHTVRDGRIVETRHVEDWLGTLIQLGTLPLSK
jgi:ketosteroid isomerase-like protein